MSTSKASCLSNEKCNSPSVLKEELKRLKFFELSLKEQIKDLSLQRDGLVMELQQLQEARPVLEKAYAVNIIPIIVDCNLVIRIPYFYLANYTSDTSAAT